MKAKKTKTIDLETGEEILAHHNFNDERTLAFNTLKKPHKQDEIGWIIGGLLLFFFTLISVGRITIVGQFLDDSFFNLLFVWFKFPIYLILLITDICIYFGVRFCFKKRFLLMVGLTTALFCWFVSLVLLTVIYDQSQVIADYRIDSLWSKNMMKNSFNIYWVNWLEHSIYASDYAKIDKMELLFSSRGYVSLYSGGGVIGMFLAASSAYLSIPGAYFVFAFLFFIDMCWIFTGDPFFLFKPKDKRKGRALRILSLKGKDNPNKSSKKDFSTTNDHTIWKSLNVFDKNISQEVASSDLTIKLPSHESAVKNENFDLKNFDEDKEFITNQDPSFDTYDELFDLNINNSSEMEKETQSFLKEPLFHQSQQKKNEIENQIVWPSNDKKIKQDNHIENQSTPLNPMPQSSHYGDLDPSAARKLFEKETKLTPFGPQNKNETPQPLDKQDDEIFSRASDTQFFENLYAEDEIEQPIKKEKQVKVKVYNLPPLDLLKDSNQKFDNLEENATNAQQKALAIASVFDQFNVKAKVKKWIVGPTITKFEILLDHGTKVNSITALENDLKLALASPNIRLEAPIPGKNLVGIELPNKVLTKVSLKEIISTIPEEKKSQKLLFVLGKKVSGEPLTANLANMPHLLIAGTTGSGKSVMLNTLIISILLRAKPSEVKFLMIDPKKVELSIYSKIPHILAPVISKSQDVTKALKKIIQEMEIRYDLFTQAGTRNIESYNQKQQSEVNKLPFIIVIIDELADLMVTSDRKNVEELIMRIAQMARAAGIHLVIATQRPSVDVITGTIKTNIPTRIAFSVASTTDSRTILDHAGAEKLIGRGDMLFVLPGSLEVVRAQGAYLSDEEIEKIVAYVEQEQEPQYDEKYTKFGQ